MKKHTFLSMLGAAAMLLAGTGLANADIITITATGSPVITASGSTYTYQATLTSDEELTTSNPQFFTVYGFDFGTDSATISATTGDLSTMFTSSLTPASAGITEAQNQNFTVAPCGANCDDIRFTYNGTTTVSGGGSPLVLGTFTVTSSDTSFNLNGIYDGQATNSSNGKLNGNSGSVEVASAVPEPMTIGLLGGGLALLGIARLRKARKA